MFTNQCIAMFQLIKSMVYNGGFALPAICIRIYIHYTCICSQINVSVDQAARQLWVCPPSNLGENRWQWGSVSQLMTWRIALFTFVFVFVFVFVLCFSANDLLYHTVYLWHPRSYLFASLNLNCAWCILPFAVSTKNALRYPDNIKYTRMTNGVLPLLVLTQFESIKFYVSSCLYH